MVDGVLDDSRVAGFAEFDESGTCNILSEAHTNGCRWPENLQYGLMSGWRTGKRCGHQRGNAVEHAGIGRRPVSEEDQATRPTGAAVGSSGPPGRVLDRWRLRKLGGL